MDAIETGFSKLPSLQLFNDILPNKERVDFEMHEMHPGCENPFVNNREEDNGKEDEDLKSLTLSLRNLILAKYS